MAEKILYQIEVDANFQELQKLEESLVDLKKQRKELSEQSKKENGLSKQERENMQKLNQQIKLQTTERRKFEKAIQTQAREQNKLGSAYKRESDRLRKMKNELKDVILVEGKASEKTKKLAADVNKLDKELKDVDAAAGDFQRNVGNYPTPNNDWGKSFLSVATAATGVAVGVETVIQVGTALIKKGAELVKSNKRIEQTFDLTGEAARKATAQIDAMAGAFEADSKEIEIAANSVVKQFGIELPDALDLIQEGFEKGSDNTGEFLAILKEYPVQFKEVGIGAEQSFAIINQQVKDGIYSDKGVAAIKEAGLKLREMTAPAKDALKAIGLSGDEIQKQLTDGSLTTFEAIQMVSSKMAELPPQSAEVGTAIADIFGGDGEDAGLDYIISLKDVQENLDGVKKQTTSVEQGTLKLTTAFNNLILGVAEGNSGIGKLAGIILEDLAVAIEVLSGDLDAAGDKFSFFTTLITQLKIQFELASIPAKIMAEIFKAFIKSGIKVATQFGLINDKAKDLTTSFEDFNRLMTRIPAIIEIVATEFGEALGRMAEGSEGFLNILAGNFEKGGEQLKGAFGKLTDDLTEDIPEKIRKLFEKEIDYAAFKSPKPKLDKYGNKIAKDIAGGISKGLIEKQEEIVQKLQESLSKGKNEKSIIRIKGEIEIAEEELKRLRELGDREKIDIKLNLDRDSISDLNQEIQKIEDPKKLKFEDVEIDFPDGKEIFKKLSGEGEDKTVLGVIFEINKKQIVDGAIDTAQQAADATFQIAQQNADRKKQYELDQLEITASREEDILKSRLDAGNISQAQYENDRIALAQKTEEKREAIERAAFEKKKKLDASQAIINGLVAISKTIAQLGGVGAITPAGAIAIGFIAAQTGVQVAAIKAQKFADGGMIDGESHEGGGVPIEAEGGEYIINREATKKNLPLLEKINNSTRRKPTFTQMSSKVYTPKMANGGLISGGQGLTPNDLSAQADKIINGVNGKLKVVNVASETAAVNNETIRVDNEFTL